MSAGSAAELQLLSEPSDAEAPGLATVEPRRSCFAKRATVASAALVGTALAVAVIGLGSRAAPAPAETSAPVRSTIVGLAQSPGCQDTPGWTNLYAGCSSHGFTESQGCVEGGVNCFGYEHFGWCKDGAVPPGKEWAQGVEFNTPELHCCACGKSTPEKAVSKVVNNSQGEPTSADCAASNCASLGMTGNCCPTDEGTMLGCCAALEGASPGAPAVLPPAPTPGVQMTFYMFRVEGAQDYAIDGANFANLAGSLWYLHNEVVKQCPRKFNVERLIRYRVTMRATRELYGQNGANFDSFVAIDQAKCTVPNCTELHWKPYGYVVGCQPNNVATVAVPGTPTWYSLPGKCPSQFYFDKTPACELAEPGGQCKTPEVTGARDCTYHFEQAGAISLDELSGIAGYNLNCRAKGQLEYDVFTDRGNGTAFWDGKTDAAAGAQRIQTISNLFNSRFPGSAIDNTYSPECKPPR